MKHKKHLLGVVMIGTMLAVTVLSGCESGKTEKTENVSQDNLVTLKEARKQAENFESEYKNLDFSEAQIKSRMCSRFMRWSFQYRQILLIVRWRNFEENIRLYEGLDDRVVSEAAYDTDVLGCGTE